MHKMYLLFSHNLTKAQKDDAKSSLKVDEFVELPKDLQTLWSNIPAELTMLKSYLEPLEQYLKSNAKQDDVVLIQGDFGGVYEMVEFCKKNGFLAVYATTKREVKELVQDNKVIKTSTFEHVIFRRY